MYPPNIPNLADLDYPKEIKVKNKELDKLYLAWAEEDSKLVELQDQLADVKRNDDIEVAKAAKEGAKKPKAPDTRELEHSIKYQEERVRFFKRDAELAGRQLVQLVNDHKEKVIELALAKAQAGVESWRESLNQISLSQIDAVESRSKSLDGIRMIANWGLTKEVLRFDPHFPLNGNFSVPSPNETQLTTTLEGLERLFLNK